MRLSHTRGAHAEADRDSIGWFGWFGLVLASFLMIETVWRVAAAIARGLL